MMPHDKDDAVRRRVLLLCSDPRVSEDAAYVGTRFLRSFGLETAVYCTFAELADMELPPWRVWRAFRELAAHGYMTVGREHWNVLDENGKKRVTHYFHVMFAGDDDQPAIEGMRRFIDAVEERYNGEWRLVEKAELPLVVDKPVVSLDGCLRDPQKRPIGLVVIRYVESRDDLSADEKSVLSTVMRAYQYGTFNPDFTHWEIGRGSAALVFRDLFERGFFVKIVGTPAYVLADEYYDLPR